MRKKKLNILCVLICIVSVTITGLILSSSFLFQPGGIATTSSTPSTPDDLLLQFFAYIENGQYEDMYELLDKRSQGAISREDFVERNRSIYEGIGVRNITLIISRMYEINDRPGRKFIDYNLRMDTIAGEITHNQQAVFEINENNEYRLLWTSRMIFPELGGDSRARVNILPAERGRILDRNGEMWRDQDPPQQLALYPAECAGKKSLL